MNAVDSAKTWMNDRPKQAMAGVAILAIIVGIVLGFGLGYKVEHDRTASDVSRLKKNGGTTTKTTVKPGAKETGAPRRDGEVTAASATSITIKTAKLGSVTFTVSSATVVDTVGKGSLTDVVAGRHALVAPGPEILVLREGSALGRTIDTKTNDAVTLKAENGLPVGHLKVSSKTAVDTVTTATAGDIKTGDHLIVFLSPAKSGPSTATQIIVVPATSKFSA